MPARTSARKRSSQVSGPAPHPPAGSLPAPWRTSCSLRLLAEEKTMGFAEGKGLLARPRGESVRTGSIRIPLTPEPRPRRLPRPPSECLIRGTEPAPSEDAGFLRILLAEDDAAARTRLRERIAAVPGCRLAGVAEDGTRALAALALQRPDLALLSLDLPDGDAAALIERIGPARMPPFVL